MDAVVTAGGVPVPGDPLYPYCLGDNKAFLDIAGKPMIKWVLDALDQARLVDNIVIVGLPENKIVNAKKLAVCVASQNSLLENVRAGISKVLEINPDSQQVLLVSSDIPAINSAIVDWLINQTQTSDFDIYYNVISREVMEARYPESRRSYTKLKDMAVCGGDMNVVKARTVTTNEELWEKIINSRKNVFKQASLIGYDTLLLLMLRQISLDQAVRLVTKRLSITGQAIVCPYAEIGMDIDKPHQLEIIRRDLTSRISR